VPTLYPLAPSDLEDFPVLHRRDLLRTAAVAVVSAPVLFATARAADEKPAGFTLGKLPYDTTALEPSIDAETMTIHHTKHHQAYVTNLNAALTKDAPNLLAQPIDTILKDLAAVPEAARTAVRNNGGGHWNHTFFWGIMAPVGKGGEPKGDLLKAIEASFKTIEDFKKAFSEAAVKQFGSGWAWLVPGKEKPLVIVSKSNQDNPLMDGGPAPILGVDVWEHAYYLKYKNLRAKYLEEWWKVVNWDVVSSNFAAASKAK
jgi:superoxide dismutase, Fe-Mn family